MGSARGGVLNSRITIIFFIISAIFAFNAYTATPAASPTAIPSTITKPQIIRTDVKSASVSSTLIKSTAYSATFGASSITISGFNCPEDNTPAAEAASAVKYQVTPGRVYAISLIDGCIIYGEDEGDMLYGTRLRIRQADDENGTNLTSGYNTVGYGAYNYGPVYTSCEAAQAAGLAAPYNPVTITATANYLYFTADDVYGGFCGDNAGEQAVQIIESTSPTVEDIVVSYQAWINQVNDIKIHVTGTGGSWPIDFEYMFKKPDRYKFTDTRTFGIESAYNGITVSSRNKTTGVIVKVYSTEAKTVKIFDFLEDFGYLNGFSVSGVYAEIDEANNPGFVYTLSYTRNYENWNESKKLKPYDTTEIDINYSGGFVRKIKGYNNGLLSYKKEFIYQFVGGVFVIRTIIVTDGSGAEKERVEYDLIELNAGYNDDVFLVLP